MKEISESSFRKIEWSVAIIVTFLSVYLHFVFMRHGGGLWRDEAGAVNLAEMPSLRDVWHYLSFDSFPIFWVLVMRIWSFVGLGTAFGYRVLGFLMGLLLLASFWFTARCFKSRFPVVTLALLAINPLLIVYGDSMRAWGVGIFWITLVFGLVWLVVESPSRTKVIWAIVCAVGAVQSTYYNSVLLFVLCTAGALVALRRRLWRRAALVIGIGVIPAISMLPYLQVFRAAGDHYSIERQTFSLNDFLEKLPDAMSGRGAFSNELLDLRVWWVPLILAAVVMIVWQFLPEKSAISRSKKDLCLFAALAIILSVPAFFLFLHELRFVTSPWYYLSLMAIVTLSLDAIFSVAENWEQARLFRLISFLIIVWVALPPAFGVIRTRMTNVDLLAHRLNQVAGKNDLIILDPSFLGPPFMREYHGAARWTPLPRMDCRVHRYDILKELILRQDKKQPIQDVLDDAAHTLKSGANVWLISLWSPLMDATSFEPDPPPNYPDPNIYNTVSVVTYWSSEMSYFLHVNSLHYETIEVQSPDHVSDFENANLLKVWGWHDQNGIRPLNSQSH